jgi:hypothetical protein
MASAFGGLDSPAMNIPSISPYRVGSGRFGKPGNLDSKKQLKARAKAKRGKKARRQMYQARK